MGEPIRTEMRQDPPCEDCAKKDAEIERLKARVKALIDEHPLGRPPKLEDYAEHNPCNTCRHVNEHATCEHRDKCPPRRRFVAAQDAIALVKPGADTVRVSAHGADAADVDMR